MREINPMLGVSPDVARAIVEQQPDEIDIWNEMQNSSTTTINDSNNNHVDEYDESLDRDPREFRAALERVIRGTQDNECDDEQRQPTDKELAEEKAIAGDWKARQRFSRATPDWIHEEGWPQWPQTIAS